MKRGKPRRRSEADKERWESAWHLVCGACGTRSTTTLHHVVYAQHVRSKGGDEWCPDNALSICWVCHTEHHGGTRRIPFSALSTRNREFAGELFGLAAGDYFKRYYGGLTERRVA